MLTSLFRATCVALVAMLFVRGAAFAQAPGPESQPTGERPGARPMYNAFRKEADLAPYAVRPVSEEMRTRRNDENAWGAEFTAQLHLEKEDSGDDQLFNEIIWRNVKGADSPMPAPVRAAFVHPIEDEDDGD